MKIQIERIKHDGLALVLEPESAAEILQARQIESDAIASGSVKLSPYCSPGVVAIVLREPTPLVEDQSEAAIVRIPVSLGPCGERVGWLEVSRSYSRRFGNFVQGTGRNPVASMVIQEKSKEVNEIALIWNARTLE